MRSIGGMRRIQIVIDENRLRLLKEQWLPVAAFVALTLPLVFIEPTPSQPAGSGPRLWVLGQKNAPAHGAGASWKELEGESVTTGGSGR